MRDADVEKAILEAEEVATLAHSGQKYGKIFPYTKHLRDVVNVLERHRFGADFIIAGWLHDVIEDCNVSYSDIKKHFEERVAEMVYCVTDELGRDRSERKLKTLKKTASNPDAIILKLADRIANVKSGEKIEKYRKEYTFFHQMLFHHSPPSALCLWRELSDLLNVKLEIRAVI